MRKFLLMFAICSIATIARANESEFKADSWSKGTHILAGFGVNTSVYNNVHSYRDFGLGLNFKTDVGYYTSDRLAFEVGSDVKFNWVDGYLVWDTLFTLGVRYRFDSLLFSTNSSYARAFFGAAPMVVFTNGTRSAFSGQKASRVQFNGPVLGTGIGRFYQTPGGLIWFAECDVAYQWIREQDVIQDTNDVPIVISSGRVTDGSRIFSVLLNVGMLVF